MNDNAEEDQRMEDCELSRKILFLVEAIIRKDEGELLRSIPVLVPTGGTVPGTVPATGTSSVIGCKMNNASSIWRDSIDSSD